MRAVSLVSFTVGASVALVAVDPREQMRTAAAAAAPAGIHDGVSSDLLQCMCVPKFCYAEVG